MAEQEEHTLTPQQRVFMLALQVVILESGAPASAEQLREYMGKSDSRVRSHIKMLMGRGYVCCVGKDRVKRYVPSDLWMEDDESSPLRDGFELACLGGRCSTSGCTNMSEDYWRDGYYCRQCIVGHDWISDHQDIRRRYEEGMAPPSSAGRVLDYVWPTYAEDVVVDIGDVLDVDVPRRKKKRSRKRKK